LPEIRRVVRHVSRPGHIAIKLVGQNRAVNVTVGLPIVRTSPSHGTAFDIAWQGVARAEGMIEAVPPRGSAGIAQRETTGAF